MSYVVTAPYVTVRTMTREGPKIVGLYADAPVPDDAPESWVKGHLEAKMIAEVADPAQAVSAQLTPLERMDAAEGEGQFAVANRRVADGEKSRARSAKQDRPSPAVPAQPKQPEGK